MNAHYRQCVELDQYRFADIINRESVVFDVGTSDGMATFRAVWLGAKSVYCFEPNPGDHDRLFEMAAHTPSIHVIPKAVSDRCGKMTLNMKKPHGGFQIVPDDDDELNIFSTRDEARQTSIIVDTITIDDFVASSEIGKVDVIKMDTEGCEKRVLVGAKRTIEKYRPILLMSAYHRFEDPVVLPEIVRQICSDYSSEMLPTDGGREPVLRMVVN